MFDNYIVEVDEHAAGILIRAGHAFTFHAVESAFRALEGTIFPDAFAAERAALRLLRHGRRRATRTGA
jgi:hypothetical protein